jgi:hypothetical protein
LDFLFLVTNWSKIASKKTTLDSGDFFENWVLIRIFFLCVTDCTGYKFMQVSHEGAQQMDGTTKGEFA